jgi:hypothetical protein
MREGVASLALLIQEDFGRNPHGGHRYMFRGRRGDLPTFGISFTPRYDPVSVASRYLWHRFFGIDLHVNLFRRGKQPKLIITDLLPG